MERNTKRKWAFSALCKNLLERVICNQPYAAAATNAAKVTLLTIETCVRPEKTKPGNPLMQKPKKART